MVFFRVCSPNFPNSLVGVARENVFCTVGACHCWGLHCIHKLCGQWLCSPDQLQLVKIVHLLGFVRLVQNTPCSPPLLFIRGWLCLALIFLAQRCCTLLLARSYICRLEGGLSQAKQTIHFPEGQAVVVGCSGIV